MINLGKEMLRISPKDSKKLEYSTTQGRSWILRYPGNNSIGNFQDLMDAGKELFAVISEIYREDIEEEMWWRFLWFDIYLRD